jgi:malonyl CoA-acyl carrier protein transacylase
MEVTMWSGRLTRSAIVGLAPVLVGCATMQNTPMQEYVWSCIEACKTEVPPQCQIVNVNPEGQVSSSCAGTLANLDKFSACMQQQYNERPYAAWLKERAK